MPCQRSYGVGQYVAAEGHQLYAPLRYPRNTTVRGAIFCHGVNQTAATSSSTDNSAAMLRALPDYGLPILACDLGFDTWGNATGTTRVGQAKTYLQETLGAKAGTVHLIGVSMGAAVALNYAKANPSNVASLALLIPAVDMQDIYANNRGGLAASIAAAHGGGAPSDANNPADNAASFTAIPTKLWYAPDDTWCTAATVTAFATAAGASTQSIGNVGHSAQYVDPSQVAAFLSTYG